MSENSFSGGGYTVTEQAAKPGKSMKPGIQEAVITDIVYKCVGQNNSKLLEVILTGPPVEGLVDNKGNKIGQVSKSTMWMTPGAWDIPGKMWCTKAKLTVMADKLGLTSQFEAINGENEEDFVNKVATIFKGKKARFVIGGEEDQFENDKGEKITFVRPQMATFGFIESTDVPLNESKLKFNEEKMIKKLEVSDSVSDDIANSADADEASPW